MEEDPKDKRISQLEAELAVFRAALEEATRWVRYDPSERARHTIDRWTQIIMKVDPAADGLLSDAQAVKALPGALAEHYIMHISGNRITRTDQVHCACMKPLPSRNGVSEAVAEWVKHFLDSL